MKKTKLKIMSLILAGVLSVGFVSYKGYSSNIKVEATETDEDTSWTVIDYNKLTDADLSADDIALMHEDNWLNRKVASQCSKSVSELTLTDFLNVEKINYGYDKDGYFVSSERSDTIDNIPKSIKFLSNLKILKMQNQSNLKKLPIEIGNLTNLTDLDLGGNKLISLPNSIGNLTNLTTLALKGNNLISLPHTIGNLTNLTKLDLGGNKLISLPNSIGNLTNLTELDLRENELISLPNTISNLTNLTILVLHYNKLTSLPNSIGNSSNLTTLSLYNNQLTSLPESIGNLTKLPHLDIHNNQLTSLPNTIGNLTNLSILYLSGNQLISIPDSIGNLTKLEQLDLGYNQLASLPESIGNLTKVYNLRLEYNRLTSVPESIGNLTKLTYLRLEENQLKSIPESIGNLTKLTELQLYSNELTSIPESIGNLTKLTELSLSNNQLISIPESIGNLTKLTELNLGRNLLEYTSANTSYYECNLIKDSNTVSQLYYNKNIPNGLTCSSLNELNNIINNIDYFKDNIEIYFGYNTKLNKNILLKVEPTDDSFFDVNGNAIKTGDTYIHVKLNHISDSNPYGYIRKTYNSVTDSKMISSDDYLKIPVHIVQRNTSVSLRVDETLPIENILEQSLKTLDVSNITEEAENTIIQALDKNIISNKGRALSIGTTQAVLITPNYGLITANVNVTDNSTSEKYLNVKFTQPNTMSLTIDTNEIDFGEVNGLTDSTEKTVIASVNSSLPYDLSIKSLEDNLTSTEGKTIPISKLNVKGEGEYTNIGTTDSIIYTNQPNTNGEGVAHPMNFKLSEMTGYTKGDYSTNLRVTATQK